MARSLGTYLMQEEVMDAERLALVTLITKGLKKRGYRYLAEVENEDEADERRVLVIRIYKGLDES